MLAPGAAAMIAKPPPPPPGLIPALPKIPRIPPRLGFFGRAGLWGLAAWGLLELYDYLDDSENDVADWLQTSPYWLGYALQCRSQKQPRWGTATVCYSDGYHQYGPFGGPCLAGWSLTGTIGTPCYAPNAFDGMANPQNILAVQFQGFPNGIREWQIYEWWKKLTTYSEPTTRLVPGYGTPLRRDGNVEDDMAQAWPKSKPWRRAVAPPGTQPATLPADVTLPTRTRPSTKPVEVQPSRTRPKPISPRLPVFVVPTFPVPAVIIPPTVPNPIDGTPVQVEVPVQIIDAGGGYTTQPPSGFGPPTTRPRTPPRKNEKEGKYTVKTVGGRVWVALNFVTEAKDFVDVLWKAIPKHLRSKKIAGNPVGIPRKLEDIWENFEDINLEAAVTLFIANQIEDMVYGKLGQVTGRATGKLGVTTGLNRAVRQGQKYVADDIFGEMDNPIPEVKFDTDTGTWNFVWEPFGIDVDITQKRADQSSIRKTRRKLERKFG